MILTVLLVAGLTFTFGLENRVDINLYDESNYLYSGTQIWDSGLPDSENAPLYAIWYLFLSFMEPDRIALYYLNYKLTTILLPILTYILLRRNTGSHLISLIISWLLLISRTNAMTWTRVSHFALVLILVTLLFIAHVRSLRWGFLLASVGSLLVSYIRPEYFLTYILSTLLLIAWIIRTHKNMAKPYLQALTAYGVLSAFFLCTLGVPITGNRGMVAFGQHFSLNWVLWNRVNINPWTNWGEILDRNFGPIHHISEAIAKNPTLFLKHITSNLLNLEILRVQDIFPSALFLNRIVLSVASLLLFGLLSVYLSHHSYKNLRILILNTRKNSQTHRTLLTSIGLFLLPGLVSSIIIYPRDHYLFGVNLLLAITLPILLMNPGLACRQIDRKPLFLGCMLILLLTPYLAQNQPAAEKPNQMTIHFIQSLSIDEHVNMLEAEGGFPYYLGDNFHRVAEYDKNAAFDCFRTDQKINMIVVSRTLLRDVRFKDDPEWQSFLANYDQFGYAQLNIPNTEIKLLLRTELLHEEIDSNLD
jgi:hypothetical protein